MQFMVSLTLLPSPCKSITVTRQGLVLCIGLEKLLLKWDDVMSTQVHPLKRARLTLVLSCISASGYVLPFVKSENGWIKIFFFNGLSFFLAISHLPDLHC